MRREITRCLFNRSRLALMRELVNNISVMHDGARCFTPKKCLHFLTQKVLRHQLEGNKNDN